MAMTTDKIDGLEYPELSEDFLMKLLGEKTAAEITLVGAERQAIPEMTRVIDRLFWEYSHNEYGHSAEKMAEDLKKDVALIKEALAHPLTEAEVRQVFKDL